MVKRTTNEQIMKKLDEIDHKFSVSSYTSISFAIYSIALACFAIGLSQPNFDFVLVGIILYVTEAIFMCYGYYKSYRSKNN